MQYIPPGKPNNELGVDLMATAITMPQLGESVTEGTVGSWLKQVGQSVEKYEPLLEVISDKVDTEITATESGTLLSIEVQEGETVPVGTVLCYIGQAGESVGSDKGAPAASAPAPTPAPEPVREPEPTPAPAPEPVRAPEPVAETPRTVFTPQPAYSPPPVVNTPAALYEDEEETGGGSFMTPVVARMVAEHSIDVSKVKGTGRDGRVTKRDIEDYLESRQRPVVTPPPVVAPPPVVETPRVVAPPPVAQPVTPPPAPAPRVETPAPTPAPAPRVVTPPPAPAPVATRPEPRPAQGGEILPLTNMRRRIAEHMVASKRISPHVTTVFEVDLSAITAHRNKYKGEMEQRGVRLTFMAYFVEAVARTLRKHRIVNATYTDDGILLYGDVNIGMAAAVQGGAGLIVPVIKHADEKNLMGLGRDVQDLTNRARNAQLTPNDVSGGTFTITNHGTGGSLWGTPIINQPQSAILGIGKFQKRVVVLDNDAIAVRSMAYLSLTFDHRVLDGASGDAFMSDLIAYLESYK
jgi:2-oxoisovalerate dehydrogenase E2 component (dihydrolipoyl transacylase)